MVAGDYSPRRSWQDEGIDIILAEHDRLNRDLQRWQNLADEEYKRRVREEDANKEFKAENEELISRTNEWFLRCRTNNGKILELQSWLDRISEPISPAHGYDHLHDFDKLQESLSSHDFHDTAKVIKVIADYLDAGNTKPLSLCPECWGAMVVKGPCDLCLGFGNKHCGAERWQCPRCEGRGVVPK